MTLADRPLVALLAHRLAAPNPTGVARYTVELTRALVSGAGAPPPTYVSAALAEADEPDWLPEGHGVARVRGHRAVLSVLWNAIGRPRVDRALGRPDLVHALYPWSVTPTRAPLVVTIHDLMPLRHPEWYSARERWFNGRGTRDAISRAAHLVVVSGFVAAQVVEQGAEPERTTVVHNGVGQEFFDAASLPADTVEATCARHGVTVGRYAIAVGAVSARKNLPVVLRALSRVRPDSGAGGAELLLAGPDGEATAALRAEADTLRLGGRVRFGGFVPRNDLPALVAGARVLVHPSRDEGFGLTPMEAMAAGTPVVASHCGSLPEVMGEAGILVDPDDPDAWAAAMTRVRDDADHRRVLAAAGRTRADSFRWTRTAAEVRAVHLRVLGLSG